MHADQTVLRRRVTFAVFWFQISQGPISKFLASVHTLLVVSYKTLFEESLKKKKNLLFITLIKLDRGHLFTPFCNNALLPLLFVNITDSSKMELKLQNYQL